MSHWPALLSSIGVEVRYILDIVSLFHLLCQQAIIPPERYILAGYEWRKPPSILGYRDNCFGVGN